MLRTKLSFKGVLLLLLVLLSLFLAFVLFPKLEAPAVSLDYGAAGSYGDSYAASTYGCIVDDTLNADNADYYPGSSRTFEYFVGNGGQSALNAAVANGVDMTARLLGTTEFNIRCCAWENEGTVYVVVYYR